MTDTVDRSSDYIIDEATEISIGDRPFVLKHIYNIFPALENRNYRIYFYAGLVSLVGTWLQTVAEGWLVLQLTNSPFWVGVVSAAAFVPTLFFALFGGAIVDRFPKKNILLFTQTASMVLALIYGVLTISHIINVTGIIILALLLGIITALDNPARQAFIPKVVSIALIGSAIALGSGTYNAARVIGPSIAGFLVAWVGSGGAFILNGLSYIAVIFALWKMDVQEEIPKNHPSTLKAIGEGLSFSFKHPIIRSLLILAAIVSIFGWSYTTMTPVIAKQIFHMDATGLGTLYAAGGLGALIGTIAVSALSKSNRYAQLFIIGGNTLAAISIILLSFDSWTLLAYPLLFLTGVGLLLEFTTLNTTIQHMVKDSIRGRVMSIYVLMFLGFLPFGSLEVGYFSEHIGTFPAIRIGAAVMLLAGLLLFFRTKAIKDAYRAYQKQH